MSNDVRASAADVPAPRAVLTGAALVLGVMVLRMSSSFDPFPGWSGDPFRVASPILGLTPARSITLDAVVLLGSVLMLLRGRPGACAWWLLSASAAGVIAVAWHARPGSPDALDNLVLGTAWVCGMLGAVAIGHSQRYASVRTLAVACVLGVVPLLVFKSAVQVLIEHPDMVRMFQQSKQEFIESQGWALGSPSALAYERRLMQSEGTAWFGLANVFASTAAWGFVACAGLAWSAIRARDRSPALMFGAACAVCGVGVVMAGAKGGYAAAGLGLGLLVFLPLIKRARPSWGGWIGALVVAGTLAAVAARGFIGERLGELSILFRWFYLHGAARIFVESPIAGTGPAGFKSAYMRLKNPLSPEDVASPHSVFFDFGATLGLAGLVLAAAWFALVWRAGRGATEPDDSAAATDPRALTRLAGLIGAAGIIGAAWLEQPVATVESTLVRFAGLVAFVALAWTVANIGGMGVALGAAALALAAQCQIELTAVTLGSAMWVMIALMVAGPPLLSRAEHGSKRSLAALVPLAALLGLSFAGVGVWRWESALRRAYEMASPVAEFHQRARLVFGGEGQGDSAARIAADLRGALGRSIEATPQGIAAGLHTLHRAVMPGVHSELALASEAQPTHFPTARAFARALLVSAALSPDVESRRSAEDEALARSAAATKHGGVSAWAWLASVKEAIGSADSMRADPRGVVEALRRTTELAPFEPGYHARLASALNALAATDPEAAAERRAVAARTLELDRNARLDPLKQLSEQERLQVQVWAQGP